MKKKHRQRCRATEVAKPNPRYKDTVFRMLFRDRTKLLELYNAVTGNNYHDPTDLQIVTLESAVYMGIKNDLALLIDLNLYLFEHQSTVNPNMPLRFLQYVAAEYGRLTVMDNLYSGRLVQLPAPHFMVFYNGTAPCPERLFLRLSNAFQNNGKETEPVWQSEPAPLSESGQIQKPELELIVQVLNINAGCNETLKAQCQTLREYMQYVDKVREYAEHLPIDEAVNRAVDECIDQGILRAFLLANKAEVRAMSIFEYNEEETRRAIRETEYERGVAEGITEGMATGKAEAVLLFLEELAPVPEEIRQQIMAQRDAVVLQRWLKAAATAGDIGAFIKQAGL